MALLYTYAMILNKLTEDLDLGSAGGGEPFITPDELLGYINEAIEEAETAVHTIGIEDTYFLSQDFINLVNGQSGYSFPADIYANKIRKIFYSSPTSTVLTTATLTSGLAYFTVASATGLAQGQAVFGTGIPTTTKIVSVVGNLVTLSNAVTASGLTSLTFASLQPVYGARKYECRKLRNIMDTQYSYPGNDYGFMILNLPQGVGGNTIQIYPLPTETGPVLQVWYIREIRRMTNSLTDTNNVCELPECINFLFQHVKWRVAIKRRMPEIAAQEEARVRVQYQLLQETFKEMVPDENNKVQMDLSAYYNQELDLLY